MFADEWRDKMADEIKRNADTEEVTSDSIIEVTEASEERELVILTDEDDNEIEFEIIGRMTLGNNDYIALMSADNDENYLILRREIEDNGEESYVTIEDDDEFDAVADAFDDEFMSEIDLDFGMNPEDNQ